VYLLHPIIFIKEAGSSYSPEIVKISVSERMTPEGFHVSINVKSALKIGNKYSINSGLLIISESKPPRE
jgi:hypothetical protein